MFAEFAAGFDLDDRAWSLAEMAADEVVVVDVAEKAYTLTVAAACIREVCFEGYAAHFAFWKIADREHRVAELAVGYRGQKIGLIFYRIDGRSEICQTIWPSQCCGIVAGCGEIILLACTFLEITELDRKSVV